MIYSADENKNRMFLFVGVVVIERDCRIIYRIQVQSKSDKDTIYTGFSPMVCFVFSISYLKFFIHKQSWPRIR